MCVCVSAAYIIAFHCTHPHPSSPLPPFPYQRRRLADLQEQHNDLLSLLAQQELELAVFRSKLEAKAGALAVNEAEGEASQRCVERYGSYIQLGREGGVTDVDSSDVSIDASLSINNDQHPYHSSPPHAILRA